MDSAVGGAAAESVIGFGGAPKTVEITIVTILYKKLVTKLIDKFGWLKAADNQTLYNDVRSYMNYVKIYHGGVFRRVALSGMLDSTNKIVKTQGKVDQSVIT